MKEHQGPGFSFRNVNKDFLSRGNVLSRALDGASFEALPGAITCIVGPTGSGKSTLLRIAAGLDLPTSGSIETSGASAGRAGMVGYLSQQHTLLPWMRVRQNIGLPLEIRGVAEAAVDARVAEICGRLGLAGAEDLYPYELSGGMQQRAALGRLLASEATAWLMDEPFTALDERTRQQLQLLLTDIARDRGLTVLFVTHSIDEAVFLADRVVVLSAGPGRVVDSVDIDLPRTRDRLAPAYGRFMERIRMRIESVLQAHDNLSP